MLGISHIYDFFFLGLTDINSSNCFCTKDSYYRIDFIWNFYLRVTMYRSFYCLPLTCQLPLNDAVGYSSPYSKNAQSWMRSLKLILLGFSFQSNKSQIPKSISIKRSNVSHASHLHITHSHMISFCPLVYSRTLPFPNLPFLDTFCSHRKDVSSNWLWYILCIIVYCPRYRVWCSRQELDCTCCPAH